MRDKKWVLNTPNLQSLWWWPWPRSMAPESHGLSGLGRGLGGGGWIYLPSPIVVLAAIRAGFSLG